MARKGLTWEELANKINQMTTEERNEKVKVWAEHQAFSEKAVLTKEEEDMCYDIEYPEDGCYPRSSFDDGTELGVALKANTYYLDAD